MGRRRGVSRRSFARRRVRRIKTKWADSPIARQFKVLELQRWANLKDESNLYVFCEEPTMAELEAKGVPKDQWPYYIGFMKKMLTLYLKFTGVTLLMEKESLLNEYVLRGHDLTVLEQIQEVAAGCAEVVKEVTDEIFVHPQFPSNGQGVYGYHTGAYLADGENNDSGFEIKVPDTFTSLISLVLTIAAEGTGNMYGSYSVNYGKKGESPMIHDAGELKIHAVVADEITELDISDLVADLEAGDYLGIYMYRAGTHANDTVDADVVMLGAVLRFMKSL